MYIWDVRRPTLHILLRHDCDHDHLSSVDEGSKKSFCFLPFSVFLGTQSPSYPTFFSTPSLCISESESHSFFTIFYPDTLCCSLFVHGTKSYFCLVESSTESFFFNFLSVFSTALSLKLGEKKETSKGKTQQREKRGEINDSVCVFKKQ